MTRLKKRNILIDAKIYFSIQPLILKGLHMDSLEIFDLFLDVKMENGVSGQIQKTLDTKCAHI